MATISQRFSGSRVKVRRLGFIICAYGDILHYTVWRVIINANTPISYLVIESHLVSLILVRDDALPILAN